MRRILALAGAGCVLAAGAAVAATMIGSPGDLRRMVNELPGPFPPRINERISSGALATAYARNPALAPQPLRGRLQAAATNAGRMPSPEGVSTTAAPTALSTSLPPTRFNLEKEGPPVQRAYPQNEESLAVCPSNSAYVLGGANDYRGFFLDPFFNGTGWYFSTTGGNTVAKEGFLPGFLAAGEQLPSSGDPAMVAVNVNGVCTFYAADINFYFASSAAAYKTTAATLAGSCKGFACWPTKKLVAPVYTNGAFVDKEWLAADNARVVVTYTLFDADYLTTSIMAVLCNTDLSNCSSPLKVASLSSYTDWLQASYVSISPATHKIYVTWNHFRANDAAQTGYDVVIKGRVCQPSGLTCAWAQTRTVATDAWVPWSSGALVDTGAIREGTMAKSVIAGNRWWVVWDRCAGDGDMFGDCSDGDVAIAYSDNDGASWTRLPSNPATGPGHQFMSTQPAVGPNGSIVIGYVNTADAFAQESNQFNSRLDTYVMANASQSSTSFTAQRISQVTENPLADWWWLSFLFWGDYFSTAVAPNGDGLVSFTGVHVQQRLNIPEFGVTSVPIHQQDNFIARFTYP